MINDDDIYKEVRKILEMSFEEKEKELNKGYKNGDKIREVCTHDRVMPTYDSEKAKNMSAYEVRKNYPRFMGECPDCGQPMILYASFEHYLAGDY